jgi:hypothetical protein
MGVLVGEGGHGKRDGALPPSECSDCRETLVWTSHPVKITFRPPVMVAEMAHDGTLFCCAVLACNASAVLPTLFGL